MNKLTLLGALALSANCAATNYRVAETIAKVPSGSFTYTVATADCYKDVTPTTLGMNNVYYQYYSFSLTAGSVTLSASPTASGIVSK